VCGPIDQLMSADDSRQETQVKYLCLVYLSPEHWTSAPDEACFACGNALAKSGHFITGSPLHPVHTATTVRGAAHARARGEPGSPRRRRRALIDNTFPRTPTCIPRSM
jgi:hypothetical protein